MNHSASRAFALIKAMNLRPVSSVAELARETGISKPSVVRLLAILIEDGFVQRASRPGSYSLTRDVLLLSAGFRDDSMIARAAAPILEDLTREIEWPTALGLFEQGAMVVRYSTIPSSNLAWYRTTLYRRLELLGSAMGQVFLAHCDEATRRSLVEASDVGDSAPAERSESFFANVRNRGYGLRLPSPDHPTFSLSVPLILDSRIAAAVSATIYGRAMAPEIASDRYLSKMREAASRIALSCTAPPDGSPPAVSRP